MGTVSPSRILNAVMKKLACVCVQCGAAHLHRIRVAVTVAVAVASFTIQRCDTFACG